MISKESAIILRVVANCLIELCDKAQPSGKTESAPVPSKPEPAAAVAAPAPVKAETPAPVKVAPAAPEAVKVEPRPEELRNLCGDAFTYLFRKDKSLAMAILKKYGDRVINVPAEKLDGLHKELIDAGGTPF